MSQVRKPRRPLNAGQLKKFISEYGDLFYDGAKVMCKACDKPLMCWSKSDCTRHVNSVQHQHKKQEVPFQTQFRCDLLLMSIICNIPLHALDKQPFRKF
ncbi:hypothetical protein QE152_g29556 [Popillia japonica]|uniref:Uncharacterized protein n=1 Tax=Popillia japonica TaxID=7064 RepID=A0AAW1JHE1_POPJA